MTIYPVGRSVRTVLWFIACVLLVFMGALAWYVSAFPPRGFDRWMVTIALGSLTLAALLTGLVAYTLSWIQRIPRLGSTVFLGYALAALFVCRDRVAEQRPICTRGRSDCHPDNYGLFAWCDARPWLLACCAAVGAD